MESGDIDAGNRLRLGAHLFHSARFGFTPQGRYVLAATWPVLVVIAAGWMRMGGSGWRTVLTSLIPILLLFDSQDSAMTLEKNSNRFMQKDRRARVLLMGLADDPPGRLTEKLPPLEFVGPARWEQLGDRPVLFTKNGEQFVGPSRFGRTSVAVS